MSEHEVTMESFGLFVSELTDKLKTTPQLVVTIQSAKTGKWGMARLWRLWMSETATYMAGNGSKMPLMIKANGEWYGERPFNENDAHDLFTSQWLGLDADGKRLSWAKKASDGKRPATKGERWDAMRKHDDWCVTKGIKLTIPRDSDYHKISLEQNR